MGIYKCKSCLFQLTIPIPERQPLCPQCKHHPRMYPAHFDDNDLSRAGAALDRILEKLDAGLLPVRES